MASSRAPRCNAGNRMSRVLAGELEDDDFYKTTYGGFAEEEEDNEFQYDLEESADEVDSDFDRSEDDEIRSEEEDVDKPKPRKKGISTKAYKEPSVKKAKYNADAKPSEAGDNQIKKKNQDFLLDLPMRKSSRKATATNSMLTIMRQKEREESDKKKKEVPKKPTAGVRRLTQEELMKLAEKTERKNLKSLEKYQRLEANRKKPTTKKITFHGPTITDLSTVVPKVQISNESLNKTYSKSTNEGLTNSEKMSRNFVVFSHDSTFSETFCYKKKRVPHKHFCPVTRKPARYIDPLTKIPYYDINAFQIIRKIYRDTVEDSKS